MKISNFIWSGGSLGAASGFGHSGVKVGSLKFETDYKFKHPKLKEYFNAPYSESNIQNQIKQLAFPNLVGNMLNANNIKNFSQGGFGLETHIRMIFSYIFQNKNYLNLSETIIAIDLTPISRVELCDKNLNYDISFTYPTIDNTVHKNFFENYFHHEHRMMVYFQNLYFFKKWAENLGIKLFIFCWNGAFNNQFKYDIERHLEYRTQVNMPDNTYDEIIFPSIKDIVSEIGIIELPSFENITFESAGFHDDNHFTPEGHTIVANKIFNIIKTKIKL